MTKNILAIIGVVAVVIAVLLWQQGSIKKTVDEVNSQRERETAVAKVEKAIEECNSQIRNADKVSEEYKVQARAEERKNDRAKAEIENLEASIRELASAVSKAGLPKPSERDSMTDEQKAQTLTFNGKTVTAEQAYGFLDKWAADALAQKRVVETTAASIARIRDAADKIKGSKSVLAKRAAEYQGKLAELKTNEDLAKIVKTADDIASGFTVGGEDDELLGALEYVQNQIDKSGAVIDVVDGRESELTPDDVAGSASVNATVDLRPEDLRPGASRNNDAADAYWPGE